jgi:glycosyltransferase involved in cell wall biosynthesis
MNILFVLYGDLSRNTAGPIILFTQYLSQLGHQCAIAIPDNSEMPSQSKQDSFSVFKYNEVLIKKGVLFEGNKRADIIHACTPRIAVYDFVCKYMNIAPTPLVIYLEDNEEWITETSLGVNKKTILELSNKNILDKISTDLSHPFEYPHFIGLCDAAIVIQKKLSVTVPFFVPFFTVPWGVDLSFFQSRPEAVASQRELLDISPDTKVIVYHGGINPFTKSPIHDLCEAVLRINALGIDCILIKTGPGSIASLYPKSAFPNMILRDLGNVPRKDLPNILNMADMFVQPGRINGFEDLRLPSKLPEFLAMGKPTVLPNCNISDIFQDGKDALLLQTGDPEEIVQCCLRVFRDSKLSNELGLAARKKAETFFDIKKQTQALLAAYKEAISYFDSKVTEKIWESAQENGALFALNTRLEILNSSSFELNNKILSLALLQSEFGQDRISALGKRIDTYIELTAKLENRVQKREDEIGQRDGEIWRQGEEIKLLAQHLESSKAAIAALHNSTSWKLTALLRWLSDLLHKI